MEDQERCSHGYTSHVRESAVRNNHMHGRDAYILFLLFLLLLWAFYSISVGHTIIRWVIRIDSSPNID